jgi:hypothetical protein
MKATAKKKPLLQKSDKLTIELLYEYRKDIDHWAEAWEISKADIRIGKALTEEFKKFLIELIEKGRAKKTIKNHAIYLWVLGGELIRIINGDESERRLSAKKLILKNVDDSGGPYWCHVYDEAEHDRYDSVCRQFFKFFVKNAD